MAIEKIAFASIVHVNKFSETCALLLASSIRQFGGSLSQAPIYFLVPTTETSLDQSTQTQLLNLNVALIPFDASNAIRQFPLATDIVASSKVEHVMLSKTDLLVWLGTNTIILKEPKDFLLPDNKKLGYRPVHHINVGSLYDNPLDNFWTLVYKYCKVNPNQIFPMTTHIDEKIIRPYFNAGILVTRPEEQLFSQWNNIFFSVYQNLELIELYKQDNRYAIFIHQAILSGIIISQYNKDDIQELPVSYNYPLHLYNEDKRPSRPANIKELVTIRYESFDDLKSNIISKNRADDFLENLLQK
jgi:hypothetical protein